MQRATLPEPSSLGPRQKMLRRRLVARWGFFQCGYSMTAPIRMMYQPKTNPQIEMPMNLTGFSRCGFAESRNKKCRNAEMPKCRNAEMQRATLPEPSSWGPRQKMSTGRLVARWGFFPLWYSMTSPIRITYQPKTNPQIEMAMNLTGFSHCGSAEFRKKKCRNAEMPKCRNAKGYPP